jgi:hypothetical protein
MLPSHFAFERNKSPAYLERQLSELSVMLLQAGEHGAVRFEQGANPGQRLKHPRIGNLVSAGCYGVRRQAWRLEESFWLPRSPGTGASATPAIAFA